MAPTEQDLRSRVAEAEAKMLQLRKNPDLHDQLKAQQQIVTRARAELKAYQSTSNPL